MCVCRCVSARACVRVFMCLCVYVCARVYMFYAFCAGKLFFVVMIPRKRYIYVCMYRRKKLHTTCSVACMQKVQLIWMGFIICTRGVSTYDYRNHINAFKKNKLLCSRSWWRQYVYMYADVTKRKGARKTLQFGLFCEFSTCVVSLLTRSLNVRV